MTAEHPPGGEPPAMGPPPDEPPWMRPEPGEPPPMGSPPPPSIQAERGTAKPRHVTVGEMLSGGWSAFIGNLAPILLVTLVVYGAFVGSFFLAFRGPLDEWAAWLAQLEEFQGEVQTWQQDVQDVPRNPDGAPSQTPEMPEFPKPSMNAMLAKTGLEMAKFLAATALLAIVTWMVVHWLRRAPPTVGESLSVGLRRLLPALAVQLTVMIVLTLLFVPVAALTSIAAPLAFVVGIGAFVYAVILFLGFWLAVPVSVIERPGIFASLGRSRALTKGYKGSVFMLLLVLFGISMGIGLVSMPFNTPARALWIEVGTQALVSGFAAALAPAAYHLIREAKEGMDVESSVRAFE